MYKYKDIKAVHLEITDKCNASCPQCLRNINGGAVNPYLALTELNIEDIKKIFKPDFIGRLKRMYMCGNYGDPIVARDTLSVYRYFRENNPYMWLNMNTNGSVRSSAWWRELAEIIDGKGEVKFGIDGLEDTHAMYRQGTDWQTILDNAKAFIDAGGKAVWDYIVFAHNEHQVDAAREMSQKLGFSKFRLKKTWRFFSNAKNKGKDSHEGVNRKGEKIIINKPKDEKYLNKALKDEQGINKKYGSLDKYLDKAKIDCKVDREKSVYVSAEGVVLPCCWLANQLYIYYLKPREAPLWRMIESYGGLDKLNAKKQSLEEIVNGDFFQHILPESWLKKSEKEGKLKVCAKICGQEFDPFSSQYK